MRANPFEVFTDWYAEELKRSTDAIPSTCCLSTSGLDGYPNSRFVALKELKDESFVIAGPLNSRKGAEIRSSSKVALCFWWAEAQKQIRIQGDATLLSNEIADTYFIARPLDAQIISTISKQGQDLEKVESLQHTFQAFKRELGEGTVVRPEEWGGYSIKPLRMEFMKFKANRFHERILYQLHNGQWTKKHIQP